MFGEGKEIGGGEGFDSLLKNIDKTGLLQFEGGGFLPPDKKITELAQGIIRHNNSDAVDLKKVKVLRFRDGEASQEHVDQTFSAMTDLLRDANLEELDVLGPNGLLKEWHTEVLHACEDLGKSCTLQSLRIGIRQAKAKGYLASYLESGARLTRLFLDNFCWENGNDITEGLATALAGSTELRSLELYDNDINQGNFAAIKGILDSGRLDDFTIRLNMCGESLVNVQGEMDNPFKHLFDTNYQGSLKFILRSPLGPTVPLLAIGENSRIKIFSYEYDYFLDKDFAEQFEKSLSANKSAVEISISISDINSDDVTPCAGHVCWGLFRNPTVTKFSFRVNKVTYEMNQEINVSGLFSNNDDLVQRFADLVCRQNSQRAGVVFEDDGESKADTASGAAGGAGGDAASGEISDKDMLARVEFLCANSEALGLGSEDLRNVTQIAKDIYARNPDLLNGKLRGFPHFSEIKNPLSSGNISYLNAVLDVVQKNGGILSLQDAGLSGAVHNNIPLMVRLYGNIKDLRSKNEYKEIIRKVLFTGGVREGIEVIRKAVAEIKGMDKGSNKQQALKSLLAVLGGKKGFLASVLFTEKQMEKQMEKQIEKLIKLFEQELNKRPQAASSSGLNVAAQQTVDSLASNPQDDSLYDSPRVDDGPKVKHEQGSRNLLKDSDGGTEATASGSGSNPGSGPSRPGP